MPVSLQAVLSVLLFAVVLAVGGVLTVLNYQRGRQMANSASSVLFEHIEREMALQIDGLYRPIGQLVDLIAREPLATAATLEQRMLQVPTLVDALRHNPALSALYVGYADGSFFLVRRLDPAQPAVLNAKMPPGAAFLVQSVGKTDAAGRNGAFIFLADDLRVLETLARADYQYDPRQRDWYRAAIAAPAQVQTRPYVFFTTAEPGITVARRSAGLGSVVGADISLSDLGAVLRRQHISPSAQLALTDRQTSVLAYYKPAAAARPLIARDRLDLPQLSDLGDPQFAALAAKIRARSFNAPFATELNGRRWTGRIVPVQLGSEPFYLAIAVPDDELLADARRMLSDGLLLTLLLLLAALPLAGYVAWRLGLPLRRLAREAKAMQDFDFSTPPATPSRIREIDILTHSMDETRSTIRRFTDISAALAAEQNFDRLLERIVAETMSIVHADAGILYLLDDERRVARPQLVKVGGRPAQALPPALDIHLPQHAGNPLCRTLLNGATLTRNVSATYLGGAAWLGDAALHLSPADHMLATIPLKNRRDETIGAILLIGPLRDVGAEAHLFAFLEALSGTAAISIENRQLIKAQVDLLEAMIQVVAGAIDAKSPYTGGHCQRVPELTKMLAQAACDARQGPFRDFSLNEDQWQEVHVASWLHDCGKMTTPEFVVDKATKLETIYDRIHEIRMRFEVIKRDRRIACLEAVAAGADGAAAQAALAVELAQLDEEFAFIAACNEGGEFMAPEALRRVERIAQRKWQRTLDDRSGVSWEERLRKNAVPAPALPVEEALLADRPEHCIARRAQDRMPADNPWGFRMEVPELLYNRGEIYNLCITRGTLNAEERYKINEHIVQTIIMLKRLPFPRHLANVPEIAGGHHEKMDGTGYPKRLVREQMSPLARMMAVADIFEALTAADRPYKKGKRLSEAMAIMEKMTAERHIDPDIFALFVDSGIHLQYARKYMDPEQIDVQAG